MNTKYCPICEKPYDEKSINFCYEHGIELVQRGIGEEAATLRAFKLNDSRAITAPDFQHLYQYGAEVAEVVILEEEARKEKPEDYSAEIFRDIASRRISRRNVFYYPNIDRASLLNFKDLVKSQLDHDLNSDEVIFYVSDPMQNERSGFAVTNNEIVICRDSSKSGYVQQIKNSYHFAHSTAKNQLSFKDSKLVYSIDYLGDYASKEIKSFLLEYGSLLEEKVIEKYGRLYTPSISIQELSRQYIDGELPFFKGFVPKSWRIFDGFMQRYYSLGYFLALGMLLAYITFAVTISYAPFKS